MLLLTINQHQKLPGDFLIVYFVEEIKKVEGAVASDMRKYIEDTGVQVQLQEVCCNQCGRKIKMEHGIVKEGLYHGRVRWEYFSQKDGEYHQFDICEDCYDKWVRTFQIPVEKGDYTEFM